MSSMRSTFDPQPLAVTRSADDTSRRKVAMYAAAGGAALVVLISAILAVKLLPQPSDGTLFASPRAACSYTGEDAARLRMASSGPFLIPDRPSPGQVLAGGRMDVLLSLDSSGAREQNNVNPVVQDRGELQQTCSWLVAQGRCSRRGSWCRRATRWTCG